VVWSLHHHDDYTRSVWETSPLHYDIKVTLPLLKQLKEDERVWRDVDGTPHTVQLCGPLKYSVHSASDLMLRELYEDGERVTDPVLNTQYCVKVGGEDTKIRVTFVDK